MPQNILVGHNLQDVCQVSRIGWCGETGLTHVVLFSKMQPIFFLKQTNKSNSGVAEWLGWEQGGGRVCTEIYSPLEKYQYNRCLNVALTFIWDDPRKRSIGLFS